MFRLRVSVGGVIEYCIIFADKNSKLKNIKGKLRQAFAIVRKPFMSGIA